NYTWDASGNLLAAGTKTASFDQRNEPLGEIDGSKTTAYTYSARGTLASSVTRVNGTQTASATETFDGFDRMASDGQQSYAYDAEDRLASANSATFTYAGLEAEPTSDGSFTIARDPSGGVLALKKGAGAGLAVLQNGHGDLTATFDPSASS